MPKDTTPVHVPQVVLDGLNILRQLAVYNLFDTHAVTSMARQLDLVATAEWIENHRKEYAQGILFGFRPQDFWDAELSDMEDCRCGCGGKRPCGQDEEAQDDG